MLTLRAPLTGEPDAGNPPVRFGGRGEAHPSSLPLFLGRPCGTGTEPGFFGLNQQVLTGCAPCDEHLFRDQCLRFALSLRKE
jgi:hypothetical protein